ncbi:RluA family pseudouridine synthase [Patescibacteria group bacterium]|nr:RluA family pseudouridine synthase [Patescibacteria group bacterium]
MTNLTPFIIYEDASILVINKPSGLVVNRADTVREKTTVMDWLESAGRFVEIQKGTTPNRGSPFLPTSEFEMRVGVVHRLDKGTSGVMVIAKTKEAFENLQKQFKERSVQKEYLALVHGNYYKLIKSEGLDNSDTSDTSDLSFIVDAPIGRNPKNRMKWAVVEGGRNAVTEFEILGVIPAKAGIQKLHNMDPSAGAGMTFTLLRCIPKTGRTHQIRVHLAAVNCPVVCDKLYLSRKDYKSDSKWCPRIFLHAEKIGFKHPGSGEDVAFEAELSEELKDLISKLKCQMSKPCVKF